MIFKRWSGRTCLHVSWNQSFVMSALDLIVLLLKKNQVCVCVCFTQAKVEL